MVIWKTFFVHKRKIGGLAFLIEIILIFFGSYETSYRVIYLFFENPGHRFLTLWKIWAQDGGPKFGTLGTEFELLVGTTKLCILSKGDINWET